MMNRLVPVLGVALLAGCATVKSSYVRPDYETVDKQQVKHLAVVTQPLPDGKQSVGDLWSLITRQYVNQNRDFIVKKNVALPDAPQDPKFKALCTEGTEGVLWLEPTTMTLKGKGAEAGLKAQLVRCRDGEQVWSAEAAGSWPSEENLYKERTAEYAQQFGPEVTPYVAPSIRLLWPTLKTLPKPELTDAEKDEKIELGE